MYPLRKIQFQDEKSSVQSLGTMKYVYPHRQHKSCAMQAELSCLKIHFSDCTIITSISKANPNYHFHFRPTREETALILEFFKSSPPGGLEKAQHTESQIGLLTNCQLVTLERTTVNIKDKTKVIAERCSCKLN